jgi:hypothetical protein
LRTSRRFLTANGSATGSPRTASSIPSVLDADDSRVKQVMGTVDQSHATSIRREVALAFFADVARIGVGGSAETIMDWVTTQVSDGGQERIGPILVTLDSLRAVDHVVVFAVD